eukprot:scaffold183298_cov17-Tisochrysis_lutea.AAC.1
MLVEVIMAEPSAPPTQQQQPQQAGPSEMEVETARAAQGQQPGQQQQQQGQEGRGLPQQHPLLEALKSSDALVAYLRAYPPQAAAQVRVGLGLLYCTVKLGCSAPTPHSVNI